MIEASIKINGCTIAHLYAHNAGELSSDGMFQEVYNYNYKYYEVSTGEVKKGIVTHNRKDLAARLLMIIFQDIEGEISKKKPKKKRKVKK